MTVDSTIPATRCHVEPEHILLSKIDKQNEMIDMKKPI